MSLYGPQHVPSEGKSQRVARAERMMDSMLDSDPAPGSSFWDCEPLTLPDKQVWAGKPSGWIAMTIGEAIGYSGAKKKKQGMFPYNRMAYWLLSRGFSESDFGQWGSVYRAPTFCVRIGGSEYRDYNGLIFQREVVA